jgi:hypothetical protein
VLASMICTVHYRDRNEQISVPEFEFIWNFTVSGRLLCSLWFLPVAAEMCETEEMATCPGRHENLFMLMEIKFNYSRGF